jgi:hypothetical protein
MLGGPPVVFFVKGADGDGSEGSNERSVESISHVRCFGAELLRGGSRDEECHEQTAKALLLRSHSWTNHIAERRCPSPSKETELLAAPVTTGLASRNGCLAAHAAYESVTMSASDARSLYSSLDAAKMTSLAARPPYSDLEDVKALTLALATSVKATTLERPAPLLEETKTRISGLRFDLGEGDYARAAYAALEEARH